MLNKKKIEQYKAIIIFGPQGSGKGTQAKLLTEDKRYFHFSTGDMFRNLKSDPTIANSEVGKKISTMESGNLVSDDLTIELFYKTLEEYVKIGKFNPLNQMLILDGIPRNVAQVSLIKDKINVIRIINLYASNYSELIKRIVKRAEKEGRIDDKDENAVRKRLEIYKKDTAPVLNQYKKEMIIDIDALPPIEEVRKEIIKKLIL